MITLETIISRNNDIISTQMDSDTVMMSIENGKYYGLDPISGRIWELMEQPIKTGDMINILVAEYEVDQYDCERDLLVFLKELLSQELAGIKP